MGSKTGGSQTANSWGTPNGNPTDFQPNSGSVAPSAPMPNAMPSPSAMPAPTSMPYATGAMPYADGGVVDDALRLANQGKYRLHQTIARHGYATDGEVKPEEPQVEAHGEVEFAPEYMPRPTEQIQQPNEASSQAFIHEGLKGSAPQYDPTVERGIGHGLTATAKWTPPGAVADAAGLLGGPSLYQNVKEGRYMPAALQVASVGLPAALAGRAAIAAGLGAGASKFTKLGKPDAYGMPGYIGYQTAEDWGPGVLGKETYEGAKKAGKAALEKGTSYIKSKFGYADGGEVEDALRLAHDKTNPIRFHQTIARRGYQEGGSAPYGAAFIGDDKVILGAPHGDTINLSDDLKSRVQEIAKKHGAYYEGNAGDVEANKGIISEYKGSWDTAHGSSVKGYPIEYLAPMFSNVEVNKPHETYLSPNQTIIQSLLANQAKAKYFQDRKYDEKSLRDFLKAGSEKDTDLIKMGQLPATKENLQKFFTTGESLMWPENWQEYPHNLGKLAKKFEDRRNQYLLDAPPGVYVAGAGHIPELKRIKNDLNIIGGERSSFRDGGEVDDALRLARSRPGYATDGAVEPNIEPPKKEYKPFGVLPLKEDESGIHFDPYSGALGSITRPAKYFYDTMSGKKEMDPTSEESIRNAVDLAGAVTLGAGAGEAPAGALRAGAIREGGPNTPSQYSQNFSKEGNLIVRAPAKAPVEPSPPLIVQNPENRNFSQSQPPASATVAPQLTQEIPQNVYGYNPQTRRMQLGEHYIDLGSKDAAAFIPYGKSNQAVNFYDKNRRQHYGRADEAYLDELEKRGVPKELHPYIQAHLQGATPNQLLSFYQHTHPESKNIGIEHSLFEEKKAHGGLVEHALQLASGGGAWTRKEGQSPSGGLNQKGRDSLKAQGHDIKPPQPEGGPRRDSYCARSAGQAKMFPEAAKDPNSRLNKARRKWNCADGGAVDDAIRLASGGEVWEKPRPKSLGKPEKLSESQKASAKASAKAAGRPYPSLVDNMNAAKRGK
jgi:hypothetical protein